MFVGKIVAFERLRGHHDNFAGIKTQFGACAAQCVKRLLRRIGIGVKRVNGVHDDISVTTDSPGALCSTAIVPSAAWAGCMPTFNSHIEIIGTIFENTRYSSAISPKPEAMSVISTHVGR